MKVFVLAVLAALSAAPASAMVRMAPIPTRINPLIGLPTILPSPLSGPLAGHGVTLPAPILTPNVVFAAPASAPVTEAVPLAARQALPAVGMDAGRENARSPFAAVLPDSVMRLSAPNDGPQQPRAAAPASEDDMRGLFDGTRDPRSGAWNPILPNERLPKSRRHGLPEDDLERELGFGPDL